MAKNKLALIRYKVIDECLSNHQRKWTLDDLIEKVSDALYEYEGISDGISKRTIQSDLQTMRSDKLGYNAPIVVKDRKYYTYDNKNFRITNTSIKPKDVEKMKEVINILKQFSSFNYFHDMSEIVAKLENHVNKESKEKRNCIQFENNSKLKGLSFVNPLFQIIINEKTLQIKYKSFKAKEARNYIVYAYLLKEYRNRWFLIGKEKGSKGFLTLALDRIIDYKILEEEVFKPCENIDFDEYYNDLIGVSKSIDNKAQEIILEIDKVHAPYVLTKPFHSSQTLLEKKENKNIIISIQVIINFELEREILGFGNGIKVISPKILIKNIKRKIKGIESLY